MNENPVSCYTETFCIFKYVTALEAWFHKQECQALSALLTGDVHLLKQSCKKGVQAFLLGFWKR